MAGTNQADAKTMPLGLTQYARFKWYRINEPTNPAYIKMAEARKLAVKNYNKKKQNKEELIPVMIDQQNKSTTSEAEALEVKEKKRITNLRYRTKLKTDPERYKRIIATIMKGDAKNRLQKKAKLLAKRNTVV